MLLSTNTLDEHSWLHGVTSQKSNTNFRGYSIKSSSTCFTGKLTNEWPTTFFDLLFSHHMVDKYKHI
jgi:hypothetical protein